MRMNRFLLRVMFFVFLCVFVKSGTLTAEEKGSVAVFPFAVNALEPLDHLKVGFQKMLIRGMEDRGYAVVDPEVINRHPMAYSHSFEVRKLAEIGEEIGARWVVAGSIIQIGKRINVDLKVLDATRERRPFTVFMAAEDLDDLAIKADRIALSIDNKMLGLPQVDSVNVKGNERVEEEAILAVVSTQKGDALDYNQLDKDLRDIYRMGYFEDVKTEIKDGPRGKIVTFNVVEKPSVGKIVFEGNEDVEEDDLREELGIKLYSIMDPNKIQQGINNLKDLYREKGYYNVEITQKSERLPNNQIELKYIIVENEKVYITKIEFVGNTKYDDDDLKDIMETSEKGFFYWLTKWYKESSYLDKKRIDFDVHKITSFYHNNGFIKARLGEPVITYDEEQGLTITIEIEEGHQYGVNKVTIQPIGGEELVKSEEELLESIQIGEEEYFNREVVRKDIQALSNIYSDEGYAYADVMPRTMEDDENDLVDIAYVVSKGQKVIFERINISGNLSTRDKVIRRELKIIEGEYYNGKDLKRSTENLHRLGYFENVEVNSKKGSREDLMVVDIHVKERPTGSFSFGAGYSSVDNVVGTAQISKDNLFGTGRKLVAALRIGGSSSQYDISFLEPWLFEKPISAQTHVFKWEREYDDYTKDAYGADLSMSFPFTAIDDYTRIWGRYRYESADISDVYTYASYILRDMEGKNVTSSMAFGLERNSTNRAWDPSRGSINSISVEVAGQIFGGDNEFNKYIARSSWFFPLPWSTVFLAQGQWGYIHGNEVPAYENFYLGGMRSIRGFEYGDVSPIDPLTGDKVGGETMMSYTAELRFPIFKEVGISGMAFFDCGNTYSSESGMEDRSFATSVGAGIRYYSPMGPLVIYYGKNLDPERDEESGNFEFSMGRQF